MVFTFIAAFIMFTFTSFTASVFTFIATFVSYANLWCMGLN